MHVQNIEHAVAIACNSHQNVLQAMTAAVIIIGAVFTPHGPDICS